MTYLPQQTIRYKTYVKQALVEGLQAVFRSHRDKVLATTKVGIDFPTDKSDYPAVIVRFFERSINNAGVGHIEWIKDPEDPSRVHPFKHYLFQGDIEFAVYTLSTLDRDLITDSLAEILAFGDLQDYTNLFLKRIYDPDLETTPAANDTFISLNTDMIRPFGETQSQPPWSPEDELIYQASYRIEIHGEIYNRVYDTHTYGLVERVDIYPYRRPLDPEPEPNPHPDDPAPWS